MAGATLSRHGLQLVARARGRSGDGTSQSQAAVALRAIGRKAAGQFTADGTVRSGTAPAGPAARAWDSGALPCVAAARDAELLPARAAAPALPEGFRVMSASPGSICSGFRAAYQSITGYGVSTESVGWTTALSGAWASGHDEHINVKETRVVGYGIDLALRRAACPFDGRVVVLIDSAVTLNALTKGRSSSFPLLRAVRRVSATLLATGVRPLYRFVESEANPADLPSRRLVPRNSTFRWTNGKFETDASTTRHAA